MTQPKYTNADCPLYGSEYCAALNMESCEKCTVDCTDEEKTARVKQDLADMAALLPEDGMLCLRRRLSASALPLTEVATRMPVPGRTRQSAVKISATMPAARHRMNQSNSKEKRNDTP